MELACVDCGAAHPPDMRYSCAACGGILEVRSPQGLAGASPARGIWRHGAALPIGDPAAIVSLGEGDTPLLRADRLAAAIDGFEGTLWIKDETVNPTGSFKDRAVSVAVSRARELGLPGIVCASSGNAGASAAAYAARAGMPCVVVVPERTPDEKIVQIAGYGATLLRVAGHYSVSYRAGLDLAERRGFANTTTTYLNPYGVDGLRTAGFELADAFAGGAPDWVVVPTGAGPLVKGVVHGFRERAGRSPAIVAVQAEGCAPIARAFDAGARTVDAWGPPTTFASGISDPLIGYERDGTHTLDLVRATGGIALAVSDDRIREAMRLLARREGILAEPTGASSIAAVIHLAAAGRLAPGARVVAMVTGHGFKDLAVWRGLPADVRRIADPTEIDGALADVAG
ncbi:MAG: threonine synthase [Alphaproteobacteria bacterium]